MRLRCDYQPSVQRWMVGSRNLYETYTVQISYITIFVNKSHFPPLTTNISLVFTSFWNIKNGLAQPGIRHLCPNVQWWIPSCFPTTEPVSRSTKLPDLFSTYLKLTKKKSSYYTQWSIFEKKISHEHFHDCSSPWKLERRPQLNGWIQLNGFFVHLRYKVLKVAQPYETDTHALLLL